MPSSRRSPQDDGTSTAYRTRTLLDDVQKRQTSTPSTRPNLSALESMSAPSARLRRDHHAATGPVLLPAPPGHERPTPLAPRRRRHSFVSRRRGARLAWRSLLALAGLGPTRCVTRRSVKLCASRVTPRGVECSQCLVLAGAASLGVAHEHCDGGYAARAGT
jgi:hypothetical protein